MYSKLYNKYFYENNKFIIIPPENSNEIKKEGEELEHCVASYINKIAEYSSVILFLREKDNPGRSFYTVEVKNNKVSQCMGFKHREMTEEIEIFINKFENYFQLKNCDFKIAN